MLARSLALACALLLGGCLERKPATVAFSVDEAAFIRKGGTTTVVGHAFRTKPNGAVVNAAGKVVYLVPATAFARERFSNLFGSAKYLPDSLYPREDDPDPAYFEYTRNTKSEANGRFVFENVASGDYFVMTTVTWGDPAAVFLEGGAVYDSVTVTGKEKEPIRLILSGY